MLKSRTEKYVEKVNETKREILKLIDVEDIFDEDIRVIIMLKRLMELADESTALIMAEATQLDSMNEKLDKLIARK